MFKKIISAAFLAMGLCVMTFAQSREITKFDADWKFKLGDQSNAQSAGFNDRSWRQLDLPHDWSVEGEIKESNPGAGAIGYFPMGIGWYRKTFNVPGYSKDKNYSIEFDGVYMNSTVWINGHNLGTWPYGYSSFSYDLTPYLKASGNVIAVRVDNSAQPNSRWYSGSGIYRHVRLVATTKTHFEKWGVFNYTQEVSGGKAVVKVESSIVNELKSRLNGTVRQEVFDAKGNKVASDEIVVEILAGVKHPVMQTVEINNPTLWTLEEPYVYTLRSTILDGDKELDCVENVLGVRTINYDVDKGFFLNGKHVKMFGVNVHHDAGIVGAAVPARVWERRLEILKSGGCNAIRTAHNPPAPEFLDACDRVGMLVMDEAFDQWVAPKNPYDYNLYFYEWHERDLDAMVKRDRNHPSVVMWSIGNEIPNWSIADASRIGKMLAAKVRALDPTRPVTQGVTSAYIHLEWDNSSKTFEHLDLAGYNYLTHYVEGDHRKYPERVIVGTESYPNQAWVYWKDVEEKPYVIGDFVWTALDHLGEVGMGSSRYVPADRPMGGGPQFQTSRGPAEGMNPAMMWQFPDRLGPEFPTTYTNYCGDIDLIGDKKPQGRYRDVLWDMSPLEILVHEPMPEGMVETMGLWGWPREEARWYWPGHEGERLQVRVFTKAPQVRLEVNGEIIGVQKTNREYIALFEGVEYRPGKLVAVSLDAAGKELESRVLLTPGKPASVRLLRERYNIDNELVYLKAEVIDDQGVVVPEAFPLTFDIQGASFVSSGNGGPDDMASFRSRTPKTWRGAALLIVRPDGPDARVEVTASSEGLSSGTALFDGSGRDLAPKNIGVGLCSVIGIGADFEDSVRRIAQTGATHVELNNFMGGRMVGLSPEQAKALFGKYGLKVISDVTMASVIEDSQEYLDRWEQTFKEDAVLGVKYVSMTANLCWGTEPHVKMACEVLNKIGALAKSHGIQFLYHLHNIEFNPILDSDYPGQIVDYVMEHTDPDLVKFQDDVFWVQIGGRNTVEFLKEHADRIPMLHVKDFYLIGEGDYLDYKAVFEQFYANGGTDWVLEMEDPMTRQQMFDKAEGHNRMSQTRESAGGQAAPRPGFGGPRPQPSAAEVAARQRAQNASRLKSLRDIETNMRTLEGMPFIK